MTNQSGGGGTPGIAGSTVGTTGGVLNTQSAVLGAVVSLTPVNTMVDILTLALGIGKWLVSAQVYILTGATAGGRQVSGRLYDGTSTYSSGQVTIAAASSIAPMPMGALITLAAPVTLHLQVAANTTSDQVSPSAPTNGSGNNATQLLAVQIG